MLKNVFKKLCLALAFTLMFSLCANAEQNNNITVYLRDCDEQDIKTLLPKRANISQWNIPVIKADYAWNLKALGREVKVAVIDSGLMHSHLDIDSSLVETGYNYFTNNSEVEYDSPHGTRVGGIIMATQNNGMGINGISPNVKIVPLKAFEYGQTSMEIIVQAIYDAIDKYNCDVINMSFGTPANAPELANAIKYAEEKGVITVASVGNSGSTELFYPAAYDTVIGVGSVGATNTVSNTSQRNKSVNIAAPGEAIVSTAYSASGAVNLYSSQGGTSFSAPQVSAFAAIAKSVHPKITPEQFRRLLADTCTDLGVAGRDDLYGYGLLNIERSMNKLMSETFYTDIASNKFSISVSDTQASQSVDESTGNAVVTLYNKVLLSNLSGVARDSVVYVGVYDSLTNKLISSKKYTATINPFGDSLTLDTAIEFLLCPAQEYYQRFFMWNGNMIPLASPFTVSTH